MIDETQARQPTPDPDEGEALGDYIARCGIENFTAREILTARRVGVVSDPPRRDWWPRIVPTLQLAEMLRTVMGHRLIVGNGYRPAAVNKRAGGARRSQHVQFRALDLDLPLDKRDPHKRLRFHEAAVSLWLDLGEEYAIGLGLYSPHGGTRIHIDTGFRRRSWGGPRGRRYVDRIAEGMR